MYVLCIIEIPKMHKSCNANNYVYKTAINNHWKVVNVNVHYPLETQNPAFKQPKSDSITFRALQSLYQKYCSLVV